MSVDRRARSHDNGPSGVSNCGFDDVEAVGDGKYVCVKCKVEMAPHWPALVLANGLKLPKWPKTKKDR